MNYFDKKNRILTNHLNIEAREILIDGVGKILISCPHSVIHYRKGIEKYDEPDTLIVANYLHKIFNIPYIYKVKSDNEDANYDLNSNYKEMVVNYIKNNDIKLLIDLHQLHQSRDEIVNIGINGFENINTTVYLNEFVKSFSNNNIGLVSIDEPFAASGAMTISNYVHNKTDIDCLQIELNCKLFKTSDKYKLVLKCFREAIKCINIEE